MEQTNRKHPSRGRAGSCPGREGGFHNARLSSLLPWALFPSSAKSWEKAGDLPEECLVLLKDGLASWIGARDWLQFWTKQSECGTFVCTTFDDVHVILLDILPHLALSLDTSGSLQSSSGLTSILRTLVMLAGQAILLFYRWKHWGSEKLKDLSQESWRQSQDLNSDLPIPSPVLCPVYNIPLLIILRRRQALCVLAEDPKLK